MQYGAALASQAPVALLAEGVDRNHSCLLVCFMPVSSPSSRRAWIEISNLRGLS